ncbi:hypothetical protein CWB72_12040 [Pseudoalteromonas phenolica]|uniref:pirin family protein n=2 Tax=Pseudoalteromonas TaxID=53246 RepID=UPI00110B6531|nr:pirin family protein [Pseudoalteromonas phenolica]TMN88724.1 hypothetical protein CWB72_12040 [Pseudoalteromonas phenolica]
MALKLSATEHDIGGLNVKRLLPHMKKRMVGPFIFFDHMGPTTFSQGEGIDVKPHPHIGLSTLTYLIEGKILHRDSLGNNLEIAPGDVNWMTAGSGITHSERESVETRASEHALNGLQSWIALPAQHEDIVPTFTHVKREALPKIVKDGVMTRLIAGNAYGLRSPIKTYSEMFYLDVIGAEGKTIDVPNPDFETALYVLYGQVMVNDETIYPNELVLLEDTETTIKFAKNSRVILLGGEKWQHVPYIHWNFVSFSKEKIEQAKQKWIDGKFPEIPSDKLERVEY